MNSDTPSLLCGLSSSARMKIDPYLTVAFATQWVNYAKGTETEPVFAIGFTLACVNKADPVDVKGVLLELFAKSPRSRLSKAHLNRLTKSQPAYLTADVSAELFVKLAELLHVTEMQLCANLLPNRVAPRMVMDPSRQSELKDVFRSTKKKVLAVIDHGCPFAHKAFLNAANETRVLAVWDQDEVPDFPVQMGSIPKGYGYGRQVHQSELNQLILGATFDGRVNEDHCYRLAQYPGMRSSYTHGSCTLGLAASKWLSPSLSGHGRSEPCDDVMDADVIFVQLPRAIPMAPDRGSIERSTLDGIRYVLDCAADAAHVAVVVDYGTEMGPHDGTSWFERALDAMVDEVLATRKITLKVIFPSGNSHEKKRHAVIFPRSCPIDTEAKIGWWIPRSNDAPLPAEIWVKNDDSNFEFSISAPGIDLPIANFIANQDVVLSYPSGVAPFCVIVCRQFQDQRQILIQVSPTNAMNDKQATPPAGVWTMTFKPRQAQRVGPIFLYTCWGGRNPGMPQRNWPGRFFVGKDHQDLVEISGDGSLIGSGCGENTLMAGGYEKWNPLSRTEYSSGGKARGGKRSKNTGADFLAVTEESPVLPGLLCLGTRSAGLVRVRGTSFAAPQLARKTIANSPISAFLPSPINALSPGNLKRRKEYGEPRMKS